MTGIPAKVLLAVGCMAVLLDGCSTSPAREESQQRALVVDRDSGEVKLTGSVQKTQAPRMTDWGATGQALLGAQDGDYHEHFVFLMDAQVSEIHDALLEIGADSAKAAEGEMHGTPVEILIEWSADGRTQVLAYQEFFQQKTAEGVEPPIIPWRTRFVFHGLGAQRGVGTGCIACPLYCPGGIIGNVTKSTPTLRADWGKLPQPGTKITAVIRIP